MSANLPPKVSFYSDAFHKGLTADSANPAESRPRLARFSLRVMSLSQRCQAEQDSDPG